MKTKTVKSTKKVKQVCTISQEFNFAYYLRGRATIWAKDEQEAKEKLKDLTVDSLTISRSSLLLDEAFLTND